MGEQRFTLRRHREHARKTVSKKLKQFDTDTRWIVRKITLGWAREWYEGFKTLEDVKRAGEKVFMELRKRFGVKSPTRFVFTEQWGRNVLLAITDNIRPASPPRSLREEKARARAWRALWAKALRYYEYKLRSGELYLADVLKRKNYVYGKKEDSRRNRLYFIDADVYLHRGAADMVITLQEGFDKTLASFQRRFGAHTDFEGLLAKWRDLLNEARSRAQREKPPVL